MRSGSEVHLLSEIAAAFGRSVLALVRATGALGLVTGRALGGLPSLERRELLRCLSLYGHGSLRLTIAVAAIAGATVVLQTSLYVQTFGARTHLGWAASYAMLWEFGPLLIGLLMAAKVGARNAAELASLSIGGQLEGLRGISLDPYGLLVAPRVVATVLSVLGLSVLAFAVGIASEALVGYLALGLPVRVFLGTAAEMLGWKDLLGGVIKAACFGLVIALVSTTVGLRANGGARGVGRAASSSVVYSAAALFLLDFSLTLSLTKLVA
jgi:phospholipid/cholesterol/gamma-HCH transport system permease protein